METQETQVKSHSCSPNTRTSAHTQNDPPRWSPLVSFRMGARRTSATARDKGSLPAPNPGTEAKKRQPEAARLCHCTQGAESGVTQPLLSKQLGRLATDVSSLCRDLSGLQSHVWRLEQEARGWALELAALHLENRRLAKYTRRLESRCRVLETRSRRLNLRLLGLPEGIEGSDAVSFLRRTLPEVLGWPPGVPVLEIESARRVCGQDSTAKPRPLLFRLLRLADKAAVLEAARARPLRFAEAQLAILPDLGAPRRRPPPGPFRRNRWVVDLLFGGQPPSPWGLGRGPMWQEPPASCAPLAAKPPSGMPGSQKQHNP
ncbi:PREDICTED: uncharacterized protein LOC106543915 [Thamnophis sirtalis]|uniref:Uncharacterized protein LOC106543915 n=1 Tax=Thamnophis sirtalis TaxID=35019 RepID=A0A6I9XNH3_9SAUR|nr:PREDICTED: uncharacterized protein LOC106543915 [Thamnophis sirtalis]